MATVRNAPIVPADLWRQLRPDWLVVDQCIIPNRGDGRSLVERPAERPIERPIERPAESLSENLLESSLESLVRGRLCQLEKITTDQHPSASTSRPLLLVAQSDPTEFLASFWAALLSGWNIALANPNWGQQEWQSVSQLLQPSLIWPDALASTLSPFISFSFSLPTAFPDSLSSSPASPPAILIPTGGSSGNIKFACHTWHSLTTAALGFCNHFQPDGSPVNAYCVLPLYHVSGLMQAIRTLVSGGQLFFSPFKSLLSISSQPVSPSPSTYLSLVPTQLERLLRANKSVWLSQFHAVLLGGAPPWHSLISQAIAQQIPIYLSYGMTETGAMVTAARVESSVVLSSDELSSIDQNTSIFSSGQVLPHATVRVERDGQGLPSGEVGQIVVRSAAIAQGYYSLPSSAFASGTFYTDDLGYLDAAGALHVTGRASRKIISGGENVFPTEVEVALRSTGQVSDVVVIGLPHPEWGEVVTAVYVPIDDTVSAESLKRSSKLAQLSRYKHPKRWIAVSYLPRNAQGKLNQSALLAKVSADTGERLYRSK
ncbi:MAG: AMP-binding protein [Phormidesmis sp.]